MVTRAVFLDRDGVINANLERDGKPVAPTMIEEFKILPGVPEAVLKLKAAGFLVIVVTNQPDISSGRTSAATVAAIHERLRELVAVDDIKVCPHTDADNCPCRKPKPGMLFEAAAERGIDLGASIMVGDRWRDIDAGRAAGCVTFLVDDGSPQERPSRPDGVGRSLPEAVSFIVGEELMSGVSSGGGRA